MTINVASQYKDAFQKLTSLDLQNIPPILMHSPFWLTWQPHLSTTDKGSKVIKKPMGGLDWVKTATTYDANLKRYSKKQSEYPTGLGFLFNTLHPFICVDIDVQTQANLVFQKKLKSYTEYSPSGIGTHVLIQTKTLEDKMDIVEAFGTKRFSKKDGRDLFISSGYVTMTGDMAKGSSNDICVMSVEEIKSIVAEYFNPKITALTTIQPTVSVHGKGIKKLSVEQVRVMLRNINVQNLTSDIFELLSHPTKLAILDPEEVEEAREPWLIICQAVHHNFSGDPEGLFLLHEWSKKGAKYDKDALVSVYESFSIDPKYLNQRKPVTIASLIALLQAQQPDFPDRSNRGAPLATIQNLEVYLKFYKYHMKYNLITMEAEVDMPQTVMDKLSYKDNKTNDIDMCHRIVTSELIKLNMSASGFVSLRSSLMDYAQLNTYNPIEQYFTKIVETYDPTADPLNDLMDTISIEKVNGNPYLPQAIKLFLRKWLIQVCAAAHTSVTHSDRMFNNVLVFVGEQGIGKTKWVSSLFPEEIKHYCAGSGNLKVHQFRSDNVKQAMELQRTLICNINEIDELFKPKSYSAFKQLLDENTNAMVLPYGRSTTTMTRRTVFIGSTNKTDFLVDQTGNRRITIIPAADLNCKHKVDIAQLWAHAVHWYKSGEKWWLEKNIQDEERAIILQQQLNTQSMYLGDENFLEDLDMYHDLKAKSIHYKKVAFREIRNYIPGLNTLTTNNKQFKEAKRTFHNWLKQTPYGRIIPKTRGSRVQQFYFVPPRLAELPLTTLKQIADKNAQS